MWLWTSLKYYMTLQGTSTRGFLPCLTKYKHTVTVFAKENKNKLLPLLGISLNITLIIYKH